MKHDILVKYNDSVTDKKRMAEEVRELFSSVTQIQGIRGVEVIPNVIDRPNRYDLMIEIDMDPSALPAYDVSEAHKKWKADYAGYLEKKAIFDHN